MATRRSLDVDKLPVAVVALAVFGDAPQVRRTLGEMDGSAFPPVECSWGKIEAVAAPARWRVQREGQRWDAGRATETSKKAERALTVLRWAASKAARFLRGS